jgi:hypothetical protein
MTNLYDAHHQWAVRPPDERFPSLDALHDHIKGRRDQSFEESRRLSQVEVKLLPDGNLGVNGELPVAAFTNWSFGQLSLIAGAPARYLRTLTPELARDCLKHGLAKADGSCRLLVRGSYNGSVNSQAAAFTSDSYGRIWDIDVLSSLIEGVKDSGWHVPKAREQNGSGNAGLYASDRDMFVFMVNDEKPVEVGNARLGRGFFCWNSETGSATFGLTTFLWNYICGNHIVWGAEDVNELRIIHRAHAFDRFYREVLPVLNRFVESKSESSRIQNMVSEAMSRTVALDLPGLLKWSDGKPFTKREVTQAWELAQADGDDPTTAWGLVQGLTAYARQIKHTDSRVNLERRAGSLLKP